MSGPALAGVLVFLLLAPLGVRMIGWLDSRGLRKRIRSDGPVSHHAKAGTPTMGGLIFVAAGVLGGADRLDTRRSPAADHTVTLLCQILMISKASDTEGGLVRIKPMAVILG